jgi:hypothetical protein
MNPIAGWGLAVIAVAAGYVGYGWPGVLLAVSVVVFWLLLQFSRLMRVMQRAGRRPVGDIGNAVMLYAHIKPGMKLLDILPLAGSLGRKVADDPETFVWTDAGGDRVRVELRGGRTTAVALERAAADAAPEAGAGGPPPAP